MNLARMIFAFVKNVQKLWRNTWKDQTEKITFKTYDTLIDKH